VNGIISFGLIGMMLLPVYPITPYAFLPFIAGAATVNRSIVSGETFPLWWYIFITVNSAFYMIVGLSIFRLMEKKAKKLNKLGQY